MVIWLNCKAISLLHIVHLVDILRVKVNILYIDKEKLEKLRKQDSKFYLRLRFQSLTDFSEVFHRKN